MVNNFDILYKTIFHELAHLKLNNAFYKNEIDLASYRLAYDDVIRKVYPDIYKALPSVFKTEIYADMKATTWLNRFKKEYDMPTYNKNLHQRIKDQIEEFNTHDIKLNNFIINYHDLAFKALIEKPELYDKYNALHIEFKKIKDAQGKDHIVRRTKKELLEDVEKYNKIKNEVYELKDTYEFDSLGSVFRSDDTRSILEHKGITYDNFIEQSNRNRVRLDIIDSYKSDSKNIRQIQNRGFSSISILYFILFIVVLFGILFGIGLLLT